MARSSHPQEGRGHAQLREQQPFRNPLRHVRRRIPQGRTHDRGEGGNQGPAQAGTGQ